MLTSEFAASDEKRLYEDNASLQTSEAQTVPVIDERKLLFKIDLRLVPCLCILYTLAFLDR